MCALTLRSTPPTLTNIKPAPHSPRIRLAALDIHQALLCLHNRTGLALIIHAQHLAPDLELAALGAHGQRLEKLQLALAVEDMARVELRNAIDGRRVAARVEVDDVLVGVLEGKDDGVGWEGGELGVEFLESGLDGGWRAG